MDWLKIRLKKAKLRVFSCKMNKTRKISIALSQMT